MTTRLDPTFVTTLLRRFEWTPTAKVPGRYEVWTLSDETGEMIVPLDPSFGDYEVLLERVHRRLIARYGDQVEKLEAFFAIASAADLQATQWKRETPTDAGLISWAEGEAIFAAAKESLLAAARSVHGRRMVHGQAGGHLASRFLDRVYMGQTEIGSYVVTAHVPSGQQFHVTKRSETRSVTDFRKAETVSGAQIMQLFDTAVEATRTALDEHKAKPRIEAFVEAVDEGVSLELVRALGTLARGAEAAVIIERGSHSTVRREIVFDARDVPVLDEVAKSFVTPPEPKKVTLVGEVSLLDNSTAEPVHLVRLDVMSGATQPHVRLRLSPEQYKLATEAHATNQWVSVRGVLEKDKKTWWLYNASDLKLVPSDLGPMGVPQVMFGEIELLED